MTFDIIPYIFTGAYGGCRTSVFPWPALGESLGSRTTFFLDTATTDLCSYSLLF